MQVTTQHAEERFHNKAPRKCQGTWMLATHRSPSSVPALSSRPNTKMMQFCQKIQKGQFISIYDILRRSMKILVCSCMFLYVHFWPASSTFEAFQSYNLHHPKTTHQHSPPGFPWTWMLHLIYRTSWHYWVGHPALMRFVFTCFLTVTGIYRVHHGTAMLQENHPNANPVTTGEIKNCGPQRRAHNRSLIASLL